MVTDGFREFIPSQRGTFGAEFIVRNDRHERYHSNVMLL